MASVALLHLCAPSLLQAQAEQWKCGGSYCVILTAKISANGGYTHTPCKQRNRRTVGSLWISHVVPSTLIPPLVQKGSLEISVPKDAFYFVLGQHEH